MSAFEQVACVRPTEPVGLAGFYAPFRFLTARKGLNFTNPFMVLLVGWAILGLIFLIVYIALPTGFWNTYNGFKNVWVSVVFTFLIFFIVVFTYVVLTRDQQCAGLEKKRRMLAAGDVFIAGAAGPLTSDSVAALTSGGSLVRRGRYQV